MDWAPVYSLSSEHLLKKSSLLTTLPILTKEWRLTFEINPKSYASGYSQVVQITKGGKSGQIGDRTPSLWFHKSRGVYLATTLSGKANVGKFFRNSLPRVGEWTRLVISQAKVGSKYIFSLILAGKELWSAENLRPLEFSDVKVYASSPWYPAQEASIRGLRVENKLRGKCKVIVGQNIYESVCFSSTQME